MRASLGVAVVGLFVSGMAWSTGNAIGGSVLGVAAIGSALGGLRVWQRGRLGAEPHSLALILWLGATYLGYTAGGTAAPAMFALSVLPGIMALFTGRAGVLLWAGLCALTPVAYTLGRHFVPESSLQGDALVAMRLAGPLGANLFVTVTTLAYQSSVVARERSLRGAREDAERERESAVRARREAELARLAAERAREEAVVANRAKSAFLATMSHEIRTPLTAVVGLAELLQADILDDAQDERLRMLSGAGRTLLGIVDDVLDLSRIESGRLELESQPVHLRALVRDVAGVLKINAAARQTTLLTSHLGPSWLLGDQLRLRQILLNLVGNAVKFTDEGEVRVDVEVHPTPEGPHRVRVTVSDTGEGIPADRQEAVLRPFTQADQSTSRRHGGTGLGLSIVVRLVELMGGTLTLESAVGQGTSITIQLDLTPCAAPPAPRPSSASQAVRRVLLAEDNPVNQVVVAGMLQRLGCEVRVAEDGEQAVQVALAEPEAFDLVLMDCQMPRTDGFAATRQLRAAGWTRPIVALTANATPSDRQACIEAGMDGFASKPLTLDELRQTLAEHGSTSAPPPPETGEH